MEEFMFILWRKYPLKNGEVSLRAEVVKSYRDKISGEPRNKLVCYLGSIREKRLNSSIARAYFWLEANSRIARLFITANEKDDIRSQVRKRISTEN
jgi:hypothetical protein